MKVKLCSLLLCFFLLSCASRKIEKEEFYVPQYSYPDFSGGDDELRKYLTKVIQYPISRLEDEEYVVANCLIGKDGAVKQVVTASVLENEFGIEVKKVLQHIPKFIPGRVSRKPSELLCVIPVYFRIAGENEQRPFIFVEQLAQFPGGNKELEKFICKNVKYSFEDHFRNKKRKLQAHFELDKTGALKYSKIVKGISPKYDKRLLDALNKMPKWVPGSARSFPPRLLYRLTISYDTKWVLCYPKPVITVDLDSYSLRGIDTDSLPEDYLDDIFENKEKIKFYEPIYIIGHK
ncbi:hypothetical protein [Dysgonomonas sp. 511]|uniref:hypothetical protein n=1 Tax=Dysgonomonas sp. 511 TaxID=2302930 RepID=UPI0013D2C3B9|nr:hypothetical protein [Dysgonomonas sp. 511]